MKSVPQICRETGMENIIIHHLINNYDLPRHKFKGKVWVDNETEDRIHMLLYFLGKIEHVILESKMNNKN